METQTLSYNYSKEYEKQLSNWIAKEKAAIHLIKLIGDLWFDKGVELVIFRNQLIDRSVSEILKLHHYANEFVGKAITIYDTLNLAKEISKKEIKPSRIDIGKLAAKWITEKDNFNNNIKSFINIELKDFFGENNNFLKAKDVVLFGFGRIGRLLAREIIAQRGKGQQLRLRAIVTRQISAEDIVKRASLLRMDSVHGPFPGTIIEDIKNNALIINGNKIHLIGSTNPSTINYTDYGINNALLIDNSGVFRDREGLGKHLLAKGIDKVLLTAPGKDDIPNVVYGVNQNDLDIENEKIFSAASCTTNAIVPVLYVIENTIGIEKGHIETIHAYTNDQNLLDNYHKKYRRGRSAPLNMVITETGAGKAVAKVIPQLKGKLTANAVRVPTPDVSLAILNLKLKKTSSLEEINNILKDAALNGNLVEQIQYSISNELVSSDLIGNPCAAVYDSPATKISSDGKNVILYVWYDNEYGYTRQVVRLAKYISKVRRLTYY